MSSTFITWSSHISSSVLCVVWRCCRSDCQCSITSSDANREPQNTTEGQIFWVVCRAISIKHKSDPRSDRHAKWVVFSQQTPPHKWRWVIPRVDLQFTCVLKWMRWPSVTKRTQTHIHRDSYLAWRQNEFVMRQHARRASSQSMFLWSKEHDAAFHDAR